MQPVLDIPIFLRLRILTVHAVTTLILENQEKYSKKTRVFLQKHLLTNMGGSLDTWDPILISLVRRAMPNLIAYDVCGVQPMTGPTGLIFAMRSSFTSQDGAEAR